MVMLKGDFLLQVYYLATGSVNFSLQQAHYFVMLECHFSGQTIENLVTSV